MLMSTWTWLKGKKTYILSAIAVMTILGHAWQNNSFDMNDLMAILAALGFSSVRHGVSTAAK